MKKILSAVIIFLCIPAVVICGYFVFEDKQYAFTSLAVTVLSLLMFFMTFEKKQNSSTKLVLIAAMTALSVVGRLIFTALPAFKPVTAMVIITALYFGRESGFMTGAMTAVLSNFYFGQGPWTPFQMFTWGLIGWLAGLTAEKLKKNRILLSVYGLVSGAGFSMLMDVWTTFWMHGGFSPKRYFAIVASSLPHMIMYAVSNVIFLLLLTKPIGKKLERIKTKYGLE